MENHDILIWCETFLTQSVEISGFYSEHALAEAKQEGRPYGGVSCFFKPTMGQTVWRHTGKNTIILKFKFFTVVGLYIRPQATTDEVVESIFSALSLVELDPTIILAGDFNCRLDKPDRKASAIFQLLEEEGFELVNAASLMTYIAPNGTSAIDLVFFKGGNISISSQTGLWHSSSTPLRKHIPVVTELSLDIHENFAVEYAHQWTPRILNLEKFIEHLDCDNIIESIEKDDINLAFSTLQDTLINAAEAQPPRRSSKPWFDKECYAARKITLEKLHVAKIYMLREDLARYAEERAKYKDLLRTKRQLHAQKREIEILQAAEVRPYKALDPRKVPASSHISMKSWETHFAGILQQIQLPSQCPATSMSVDFCPVSKEETQKVIQKIKRKKAVGPDNLSNELIKDSISCTLDIWTALFNKCLQLNRIPDIWRSSIIKVLYKGKGPLSSPDSYRGIALECAPLKILCKIILNRMFPLLMEAIPEQQYGFMPGRSASQAIGKVLDFILEALNRSKGHAYVAFIDFSKAFDSVNRNVLLSKLSQILGPNNQYLRFLEALLHGNSIKISDGLLQSKEIKQTNGVLQGDPLSPIIFNVLTHDVIEKVTSTDVEMYLYADDMVMLSIHKEPLQASLNNLLEWSRNNDLVINRSKTKIMKFRRGGSIAKTDIFLCNEERLEIVNSFRYLGLTFQVTGRVFTKHIEERIVAATKAIVGLKRLKMLSIKTALELFKIKIAPIATYALEHIWQHLTYTNIKTLDKIKATYLKKALCVSKFTQNRLVYLLVDSECFIADLIKTRGLTSTPASDRFLTEREEKAADVEPDFFRTPAMTSDQWKTTNFELRHLFTRTAVHGFHHRICRLRGRHDISQQCQCILCGLFCSLYHLLDCEKRTLPLSFYANEENFE